jgi:hypothetical protein
VVRDRRLRDPDVRDIADARLPPSEEAIFANNRIRTGSPNALNIPAMTSASSWPRPAEVTGGAIDELDFVRNNAAS